MPLKLSYYCIYLNVISGFNKQILHPNVFDYNIMDEWIELNNWIMVLIDSCGDKVVLGRCKRQIGWSSWRYEIGFFGYG